MPAALRRKIGLAALLTVAGLAGGAVWYKLHQASSFFEPHTLLSRFPAEEAIVLSVDFRLLRQAGLLARSQAPLEPEYRQFVEGAGFDYKRDLDSLTASFSGSGNFFIARGRFNWDKLRAYTAKQGGSCYQELCRVQGSTPDRHISFLPLRDDAMALAVSTNDLAASRLTHPGQHVAASLPSAPVWLSVPGSELRKQTTAPSGLRLMLSALETADRIVITLGPAGGGIEAALETTCKTQDDASVLVSQLRTLTKTFQEAVTMDKQAQADELAQFLTAGTFAQADRKVTGKWPVKRTLLDSLTQGI